MSLGDHYRKRAAEFRAKGRREPNARLASEWDHLGRCYLRLAEQADSNSLQDLWFEVGPKSRLDEGDGA
jgi:hypothetical protein